MPWASACFRMISFWPLGTVKEILSIFFLIYSLSYFVLLNSLCKVYNPPLDTLCKVHIAYFTQSVL